MPDLEHYHLRLADDLEEVVVHEPVYHVPISESTARKLEELGLILLRLESSYAATVLALHLVWREVRQSS